MNRSWISLLAFWALALPTSAEELPARFRGWFPISGWVGPPPEFQTVERYAEMAEAGLTLSLHHPSNAVALGKQAGLKMILSDPRISRALRAGTEAECFALVDAVAAEFGKDPDVVGFTLRDEPNAADFPALARVSRRLMEQVPGCFPYINLFPNYANQAQLGTPTYEEHVRRFLEVVRPPILSFDHYPLVGEGLRPNYYQNLEVIRRLSLEAGIPFWAFALSTPHGPYRDPTEAELRFQIWSDLVYGAKGYCFFCYWVPPADRTWDWDNAIIRRDGKRSEHFEQVQRINRRVQAMAPVLLSLRSEAVYHAGAVPEGCTPLPNDAPVRLQGTGQLIFGFFRDREGRRWVMITNRDYAHNLRTALVVSPGVRALSEVVGPEWIGTQRLVPEGESRRVPFRIHAGDGRLFLIEE